MSEPRDTRDHHLSRVYREGAWPEPSRQIDAAILAASRRTARERHSFVRRWAPSFAVAATVVLTSALVLKAVREQPDVVSPSVPDNLPATRAKEAAPVAEPKAAEAKPAPAPQAATPPQGFSSTMDAAEAERLERLQRDLGLKRSFPASESPPPAPKAGLAEKPASALKKESSSEAPRADSLQRTPARTLETPPPASTTSPAPTPAQGVTVFGSGARAAVAPTPKSPQAQPPAPASPQAQPPAPASPQVQPPAPAPAAAPSAAAVSGEALGSVRAAANVVERSPQAWIEDIRKLMAEGKFEETGAELAKFRKRYPDYALPQDLR